MPFLNFNEYPSGVRFALSTYTKDRNNVYSATETGLYKYDFTEKTDNLVASLDTKICFFEDDYFYRYIYDYNSSLETVRLYLYKHSLDGSLVSYVDSGTMDLSGWSKDFSSKLIVDRFNKIVYVAMQWDDITTGWWRAYYGFNYGNMSSVKSYWYRFDNWYIPNREIIYSYDGINAYDVDSSGLIRIDISQLNSTSPSIVKNILTSSIVNERGTLKRIENKLYILGGDYGTTGKIYNIDDGTIEDVNLYYLIRTIDTDFNIADTTVSIHNNSASNPTLVQFDIIIYSNQYKIYNNSGLVEYASYRGQAPIVSLKFERKDNNIIEYTLRTEEKYITGSYITQAPSNLTFLGFSSLPNATVVQYPLGKEINISIRNSKDFYEVYGMDVPVVSMFDIYLYKNNAEPNRIDKSLHLSRIGVVSGTLRDETSITDIVINFEYSGVIDFNYVYIPFFNRYYFVNDVISVRNDIWNISLSVDVLMTYKDALLNLYAFVDRNENTINPMLIDKKRIIEQGVDIENVEIENSVFRNPAESEEPIDIMFVLNGYKIDSVTEI